MPRRNLQLTIDTESAVQETPIYHVSAETIMSSPVLSQLVPTPESQAEKGLGFQQCNILPIERMVSLGSGSSGTVYRTQWGEVKKMFSNDEQFGVGNQLGRHDPVALKILWPIKEIIQRIPSHKRNDDTVADYLREYSERCDNIYRFMDNSCYFGIPRHFSQIYGCSYCFSPIDDPEHLELPSMIIASEIIMGESIKTFLFTRIWEPIQLLSNFKSILLQGIYIICIMFSYNFYHNDLNCGNIFIDVNNTTDILYQIPLLETEITLVNHSPGSSLLIVRLLDYDLSTVGVPRGAEYNLTLNSTKLPMYDFIQYILCISNLLVLTVKNNLVTGNTGTILGVLKKLEGMIKPLLSDRYYIDIRKFSRSRILLNNTITDHERIGYIRALYDFIVRFDLIT